MGRDTASAIALAALLEREDEPLLLVLTADHVIAGQDAFTEAVMKAVPLAEAAEVFSKLVLDCSISKSAKILHIDSREAKSVKLFSNCYLAMRVAFFNQLDSFSLKNNMDTLALISGVSADERIGDGYNNPSFGYGGYCLPKDTKQLAADFKDIPQALTGAIVELNDLRMRVIADEIISTGADVTGFFSLAMKSGNDNARSSAIIQVIQFVKHSGKNALFFMKV